MPDGDMTCRHHEALCLRIDSMIQTQKDINGCLDRVDKALGKGEVSFATLGMRLTLIEKIVYGLVGATLLGVVGAVLALVLR